MNTLKALRHRVLVEIQNTADFLESNGKSEQASSLRLVGIDLTFEELSKNKVRILNGEKLHPPLDVDLSEFCFYKQSRDFQAGENDEAFSQNTKACRRILSTLLTMTNPPLLDAQLMGYLEGDTSPPSPQNLFEREKSFHDAWAQNTSLEAIGVTEAFEAITALENHFILKLLGDLKGKKILDIGAGLGESSLYFALKGAEVTASDISPKMVELCEQNAKRFGVPITTVVSTAENINLPQNSFDVVHAANMVHHLEGKESFFENAARVLKPGGLFVAWDPLKYNPVLNVYRRMATKVRSFDEAPIGRKELKLAQKYFKNLTHREFWLSTLTLFLKYYFMNQKHPNSMRYWKAILKETRQGIGWWFLPMARLDAFLLRLPFIRYLAWNVVYWGNKPPHGDLL